MNMTDCTAIPLACLHVKCSRGFNWVNGLQSSRKCHQPTETQADNMKVTLRNQVTSWLARWCPSSVEMSWRLANSDTNSCSKYLICFLLARSFNHKLVLSHRIVKMSDRLRQRQKAMITVRAGEQ